MIDEPSYQPDPDRSFVRAAVDCVDRVRTLLEFLKPTQRVAVLMQALGEEIDELPIPLEAKHQMIAVAVHAATAIVADDGVDYQPVVPS